jgi:hypothetical protein
MVSFIIGDFNAAFPGDPQRNLDSLATEVVDDPLGKWIHTTWPSLTAIAYDGFSRCGRVGGSPRVLSAIGHIVTDLPPIDLIDFKPLSTTIGNPLRPGNPSDHVPMAIIFKALPNSAFSARGWPV